MWWCKTRVPRGGGVLLTLISTRAAFGMGRVSGEAQFRPTNWRLLAITHTPAAQDFGGDKYAYVSQIG